MARFKDLHHMKVMDVNYICFMMVRFNYHFDTDIHSC